jgi:hypothetical protein
MYKKHGPEYHLLPNIFERMALPVYDDVIEILREYNLAKMEQSKHRKSPKHVAYLKRYKYSRKVTEKKMREKASK